MRDLAEVVKYLAQSVVDHPESVVVKTKRGPETTYYIHVHDGEEGRIIGKNGRVIQAIRTIARGLNTNRNRVQVDLSSKK
ncbi:MULTISPECIES: KH domain-containing protein [Deinococcus]|uniref:RNA-binding protein n=2 Tax=Deinococcus TaxID=1298 RepID=A0A511N6Y8_DEIC1|nr:MULTISPECIES: KH domain-containing protein [Deinococcus]GEM48181.1 RNA-binding protein [Deinococcus cellulosilyticus NBRC 106333 = KACC 11606]GGJ21744.1 RNA-binding protein [Deinococcus roseus]